MKNCFFSHLSSTLIKCNIIKNENISEKPVNVCEHAVDKMTLQAAISSYDDLWSKRRRKNTLSDILAQVFISLYVPQEKFDRYGPGAKALTVALSNQCHFK